MYYKCRNFEIYELVDSVTYSKFGEEAWMFFNTNALKALDGIREYFGTPVTVNTWKNGGNFEFRGLRPISSTLGATYSQHRFGNAFDCDIKGKTAIEVRTEILNNKNNELFKYINCLEANVTWVHFDCRNITDRIRVVYP